MPAGAVSLATYPIGFINWNAWCRQDHSSVRKGAVRQLRSNLVYHAVAEAGLHANVPETSPFRALAHFARRRRNYQAATPRRPWQADCSLRHAGQAWHFRRRWQQTCPEQAEQGTSVHELIAAD